jgi:hypothetical protein
MTEEEFSIEAIDDLRVPQIGRHLYDRTLILTVS